MSELEDKTRETLEQIRNMDAKRKLFRCSMCQHEAGTGECRYDRPFKMGWFGRAKWPKVSADNPGCSTGFGLWFQKQGFIEFAEGQAHPPTEPRDCRNCRHQFACAHNAGEGECQGFEGLQ